MRKLVQRFVRDESGVTALEYGLIAACVAVAIIVAAQTMGTSISGTFTTVANALTAA